MMQFESWRSFATGSDGAVLAMLLCGHMLGDFVFQSARTVDEKRNDPRALQRHAVYIGLAHFACLLPILDLGLATVAVLCGLSHWAVDRTKISFERNDPRPLRWFLLDQLAHLLWIVFLWTAWRANDHANFENALDAGTHALLAWTVAIYAFNVHGGSAVVVGLLRMLPERVETDPDAAPLTLESDERASAGRMIGVLERLIVLTLAWHGEFGAMAFVLTAKSIVRFPELDRNKAGNDKNFAEAYLIGTLASLSIAGASGIALAWLWGT